MKQVEKYESESKLNVSLFNLTIYFKFLRKGWLLAILPGIVLAAFGVMMMAIWPEYSELFADNPAFDELLNNPVYTALLGGGDLSINTFQGFYAIEIFTILEFLMLFLTVFIPVRIISNEVDKNTLDIALSYPISRWQFLIQKYLVYLTQMAFIPVFVVVSSYISGEYLNEPFDYTGLVLSGLAIMVLLFTLGALSLLAASLFLESGRALTFAAVLVIGMWIIDRIGALVESINILQNFSIFHYIVPRTVLASGELPLVEFSIVLFTGIIALVGALYIFQKRELAY
jgi:ABC-2 type transport system permease protein